MKFVNSPKVEYQPDGLPQAQVSKRPLIFRIIIGITIFLALSLNLYVVIRADLTTIALNNSSGAEGMVLDEEIAPWPMS